MDESFDGGELGADVSLRDFHKVYADDIDDSPDLEGLSPAEALALLHAAEPQRNKIFVTDDDRARRRLLAAYFGMSFPDHSTIEADSADAALRQLEETPGLAEELAVFVTDDRMPGMSGRQLAEALRGVGNTPELVSARVREALEGVPVALQSGSVELFTPGHPGHAGLQDLLARGVLQAAVLKQSSANNLIEAIGEAAKRMIVEKGRQ